MSRFLWVDVAILVGGGVAGAWVVRRILRDVSDAPPGSSGASEKKAPASVATSSVDYAVLVPKSGSPLDAQRMKTLAAAIEAVWTDVTGQAGPVPPAAMEVMLMQAAAEGTGYGQAWEMTGNVGSYQCGSSTGTSYYDCVSHTDSRPQADGSQKQYTTTFRKYKDGPGPDGKARSAFENGAYDFVLSITKKPFPALAEILSGDVLAYARKQYGQHYFEGFNLSDAGHAAYAPWTDRLVLAGVPLFSQGKQVATSTAAGQWSGTAPPGSPTPKQVAGRIIFYGAAMGRHAANIAAGLGHDRVYARVGRGLDQPWQPKFQVAKGMA